MQSLFVLSCAGRGLARQSTLADSGRADHDGEARDRVVGEERVEPAQLRVASEDPRSARVDDRCRQAAAKALPVRRRRRPERGAHQLVGRLRRRQAEVVREHLPESLVAAGALRRDHRPRGARASAARTPARARVRARPTPARPRSRPATTRHTSTSARTTSARTNSARSSARRSSTHAHSSPARNGSERIVRGHRRLAQRPLVVVLGSSSFGALDREHRGRDVDLRVGGQLECVPASTARHDVGHAHEQRSQLRDHGRQVARPRRRQSVRPEDVGELVPVDRPAARCERGEDDPPLAAGKVGGLEARRAGASPPADPRAGC